MRHIIKVLFSTLILSLFTACGGGESSSGKIPQLTIEEKIQRAPQQQLVANNVLSATLVANKSSFNDQFGEKPEPDIALVKQAGAFIFLSARSDNPSVASLEITKLLLLNGTQMTEIPASTLRQFPVNGGNQQLIITLPNGIDAKYVALEFDDKGQTKLLGVTPSLSNSTHRVYAQGNVVKGMTNKPAFQPVLRSLYDYGGSASVIATALQTFGKNISENEAMQGMLQYGETELIKERRSFSLLDMKQYLVAIGHDGAGYASNNLTDDVPELLKEQDIVAIAPISLYGITHYAILSAYDDNYYYFASPVLGNVSVLKAEIESVWKKADAGHIVFVARKTAVANKSTSDRKLQRVSLKPYAIF